jgi:heterodisulfide reductase subunit B
LTNLKVASHRLEEGTFKQEVDQLLDVPSKNNIEVKSVLQILYEECGLEKIKESVVKPLKGLKIAPYYGCIMNRPPEIMDFDDPENPVAMDKILEALGAEVLSFPLKVECCGASFGVTKKEIVLQLSGKLLYLARDIGADAMAVACPLCQMNLDLRQDQINRAWKTRFDMPVLYYTQLMGYAFGLKDKDLGLSKLNVSPKMAFSKIKSQNDAQKQDNQSNVSRELRR